MWPILIPFLLPALEIGLFIVIGGYLGLWETLALVFLTVFLGFAIINMQKLTIKRLQHNLRNSVNPANPLANEAFILIAGILLIIPGFFTDFLAVLLLIPPIRSLFIHKISNRLKMQGSMYYSSAQNHQSQPASETVLDGEYEIMEDGPKGNSGWTKPNE